MIWSAVTTNDWALVKKNNRTESFGFLGYEFRGTKQTIRFNLFDTLESLTYPGFLRMAWHHWRAGCHEMYRSFSKSAFVTALQRLVPEDHLVSAPA